MGKVVAVIPARYESSRFPGKPLALILGKPMIQWVYERVSMAKEVDAVFVATDSQRIADCVASFGGKAIMTGECNSGTDRVYEAVNGYDCDIVVNIQGDEPTIKYQEICELLSAFEDKTVYMATLKKRINVESEIDNPNVVKVVTDINNNAIYFSRSRIPFNRLGETTDYYRHVGMYAYKMNFLEKFVKLDESIHEKIEKLEQLRVLDNGYKIRVLETQFENYGVDVPTDIESVERILKRELGDE